MKSPLSFLVVVFSCAVALTAPARAAATPDPQSLRQTTAFLFAFGRLPAPEEGGLIARAEDAPMPALIDRHRASLQSDATAQETVLVRATQDALGRPPTEAERRGAAGRAQTYAEAVRQHLAALNRSAEDYVQVIHRAYRQVVRRDAYDLELEYWRKHDAIPHALLLACVENWARRNQPGLMVTSGVPTVSEHSAFLTTMRVTPDMAVELAPLFGLPLPQTSAQPFAYGRNVIAPGAAPIVTDGHIMFAAVGRD